MDSEQQAAFESVKNGNNIFLSGSAGTGKSFTLRNIVRYAIENNIQFGVTATTGLASILIGGKTIHSFLGIGLAKKNANELVRFARKSPKLVRRLKELQLLLIDEVSMMNAELLDKISEFLSIIRGNPKLFGGIQIVLCGDLCQLPPVEGAYCYEAKCWKEANIRTCVLTKCHRQAEDAEFVNILQELRFGLCTKDILKRLKRCKNTTFEDGIIPTILYSKNVDVDTINEAEYQKLIEMDAKQMKYASVYSNVSGTKEWSTKLRIPDCVDLCIGAQVIVTMNMVVDNDVRIPNGARGVVKEFTPLGPLICFRHGNEHVVQSVTIGNEDDNPEMYVRFLPIKLAYAITIHKSQGMTIDAVVIDLGDSIFQDGQAYTALSRARNLSSVKIIDVRASSFRAHPGVVEFYKCTC
jgi:ATP-dependent DNA helicase PIF1